MKKMTFVLAAALLSVGAAQASEFDGVWLGAKLGFNQADATGLDKKNATVFGLEGGYNWNMDTILLGLDGYADLNGKATHNPGPVSYGSRAYGLDGKLGLPMGDWLPYAKLGYGRTAGNGGASGLSGSGAHLGLGVEYKFMPNLSVTGEYTNASAKNTGNKLNNNNFTVGVNYYFDTNAIPYATTAKVAPVAKRVEPVVMEAPKPAPVVVVKEEPKEVWKTELVDKPVTFAAIAYDAKSAKLLAASKGQLDDVAEFAKLYPAAQLQIAGHTDYRDGKSKKDYNQQLSVKRAEAIKAALVERGVAAERMTTEGFGFDQPVADNKTEAGRAQNRRVVIRSMIKEEKKIKVME